MKKARGRKGEIAYTEKMGTAIGEILLRENRIFPAYRNLKVWCKAHENLLAIINLLKAMPDDSITARIKDQLIGSASSIGANIAEGSGIYKGKRFVGHLEIALDSECETDNWLQVLRDSAVLSEGIDDPLLSQIIERNCEVIKMLIGLIQSIENKRSSAL